MIVELVSHFTFSVCSEAFEASVFQVSYLDLHILR